MVLSFSLFVVLELSTFVGVKIASSSLKKICLCNMFCNLHAVSQSKTFPPCVETSDNFRKQAHPQIKFLTSNQIHGIKPIHVLGCSRSLRFKHALLQENTHKLCA
jgi:hypothetical protein